jgi:hypothetical protein
MPPLFHSLEEVAQKMAELESENRFLRWALGAAIVIAVICLLAYCGNRYVH